MFLGYLRIASTGETAAEGTGGAREVGRNRTRRPTLRPPGGATPPSGAMPLRPTVVLLRGPPRRRRYSGGIRRHCRIRVVRRRPHRPARPSKHPPPPAAPARRRRPH